MVFDTHSLEALHELNYEGRKTYMHILIMTAMSGMSSDELFADDDEEDTTKEERTENILCIKSR